MTTALIVLNRKIKDEDLFIKLFKRSSFIICADGGANRLYDMSLFENSSLSREDFIPMAIVGDLDSARSNVQDYYRQKGTQIAYVED